ncbi:MAG: HAD-IC family P-type ATPase, partial [Bacillota bacterium]|nr:HAD-IC family P-type ATPase [Bacillota bacterium]
MKEKMWHHLTVAETAKALNTPVDTGLDEHERKRRQKKYGPNRLSEKKKTPLILTFLRQFSDFMVMVLMAAAVVSAAMGEKADAIMILAIIILNGILGFIQEYKAERSLEALKKMSRNEAHVMRDGTVVVLPSEELVVGDVVLLEAGTRIPADLRLAAAVELSVEESLLTGESVPVKKQTAAVSADSSLADRSCMCYQGTSVTAGHGRGIVVAIGMDTETGRIASMLNETEHEVTPLQRRLKELGKWLIILCVAICIVVSGLGILMGGDFYTMVLTGVSLAVASIPEGLPAIVTICLALGVWRLSQCHAIVKRLPAVETLGCTTCICSDKTGTLTENHMTVSQLFLDGQWGAPQSHSLQSISVKIAAEVMARCHTVLKEDNTYLGDPTEIALVECSDAFGVRSDSYQKKGENPFDSRRRMMSVWVGHDSLVKGAADVILSRCQWHLCQDKEKWLDEKEKASLAQKASEYASQGYRILALAYRPMVKSKEDMEQELTFLGFAALTDPIRKDVPEALARAKAAGIETVMITGDDGNTALAVGRALGIAKEKSDVTLGKDISLTEDTDKVMAGTKVFARVAPEDKMKIVRFFKSRGQVVAMTGDGVNDVLALKEADCSVAMASGSQVACQVSHIVLLESDFSAMSSVVAEGRRVINNIQRASALYLVKNILSFFLALITLFAAFPYPFVPIQLTLISTLTIGVPSFFLALEPNHDLVKGKFLHNVFRRAFPGGLTAIFVILFAELFVYTFDLTL